MVLTVCQAAVILALRWAQAAERGAEPLCIVDVVNEGGRSTVTSAKVS
jgi:hypothetical protein